MSPSADIIRTEKHRLQGASDDHAGCVRMVDTYRRMVRVLCGIVFVHLDDIHRAPSQCFAAERLFHATADNPHPRYAMVDRLFHKFPSYLRRAAIEAAIGAVNSFCSNYCRWQTGLRKSRHAAPPAFARFLALNPPLYGGQCVRIGGVNKSVSVRVLGANGQWGWSADMRVHGRLKRLVADEHNRALSPTLMIRNGRALLAWPVSVRRPSWSGGDIVCAVDLGINTAATCAIVDSAGTVRARSFDRSGRHNDRLDHLATGSAPAPTPPSARNGTMRPPARWHGPEDSARASAARCTARSGT